MRTIALLLCSVALACAPSRQLLGRPPATQMACPADDAYIRNGIKSFLSDKEASGRIGLLHVRSEAVRVLSDPADAAVCRSLMDKARSNPINPNYVIRYGFYESDGYYFVGMMLYTTAGEFVYKPGTLVVFDSQQNVVRTLLF